MSELTRRDVLAAGAAVVAGAALPGAARKAAADDIWPGFPTRLAGLCEAMGISPEQAAERSGIPVKRWRDFENGEAMPEFREGMAICRLLQVMPEALLPGIGD
jgi:hypothetical protein